LIDWIQSAPNEIVLGFSELTGEQLLVRYRAICDPISIQTGEADLPVVSAVSSSVRLSNHRKFIPVDSIYLAIQDCTKRTQLLHHLTVDLMDLGRVFVSLVCVNPTNIAHSCIVAFDMELVFEADRKPMKRTHGRAMSVKMFV
jgi:hypothetical protein